MGREGFHGCIEIDIKMFGWHVLCLKATVYKKEKEKAREKIRERLERSTRTTEGTLGTWANSKIRITTRILILNWCQLLRNFSCLNGYLNLHRNICCPFFCVLLKKTRVGITRKKIFMSGWWIFCKMYYGLGKDAGCLEYFENEGILMQSGVN